MRHCTKLVAAGRTTQHRTAPGMCKLQRLYRRNQGILYRKRISC